MRRVRVGRVVAERGGAGRGDAALRQHCGRGRAGRGGDAVGGDRGRHAAQLVCFRGRVGRRGAAAGRVSGTPQHRGETSASSRQPARTPSGVLQTETPSFPGTMMWRVSRRSRSEWRLGRAGPVGGRDNNLNLSAQPLADATRRLRAPPRPAAMAEAAGSSSGGNGRNYFLQAPRSGPESATTVLSRRPSHWPWTLGGRRRPAWRGGRRREGQAWRKQTWASAAAAAAGSGWPGLARVEQSIRRAVHCTAATSFSAPSLGL